MNPGMLREAFGSQIDEIDAALEAYLSRRIDPPAHYGMIRYHFGYANADLSPLTGPKLSRGKRMRAIFSLLVGRAVGADPKVLQTLMLASEMMHSASLVHDDVEDGDTVRWGRPTLWSLFGIEQAINVGDSLIGLTYDLLLELQSQGLAADRVLRVLKVFKDAHLKLTEGQHLDLSSGLAAARVRGYQGMIARKTAAACECATESAAIAGGGSPRIEEAFRAFGFAFGMMYQVCDDIRDVWGDPNDTGKDSGRDIYLRKRSFPLVYAAEIGPPWLTELLWLSNDAGKERRMHPPSGRRKPDELTPQQVQMVRDELLRLGIAGRCREVARHYRDVAIESLRSTGLEAPELSMLENMTNLCAAMAGVAEEAVAA